MDTNIQFHTGAAAGTVATTNGAAPVRPRAVRDNLLLLLFATVATVILNFLPYNHIILYPLRLFVTFIHESGHAFASVITGGSVDSLTVSPNGEGLTITRGPGWAAWLTLSGGYLGTTIFGAALLHFGSFRRWKSAGRVTLYAASAYLLFITLVWVRNPILNPFTFFTGLILAGILWTLGRFSSAKVADFLASFLAVQCCINALTDLRILFTLTTTAPGRDNDAVFMQQHYGLPATFWAVLWAAIALLIVGASLFRVFRAAVRESHAA